MLESLDHVGIALNSIRAALKVFEPLGLKPDTIEDIEEQNVRVMLLDAGGSVIELIEPSSPDSSVRKFIDKRGEGVHHLAFKVTGIYEIVEALKAKGMKLIDEVPRKGRGNSLIAFVHPEAAHGVLIELVEYMGDG